ncbi:MAG: hypothetical protein JNK38_03630 [Acidobacteria bacterium]|nr:hypothetical protein [Acidobacteriota bacterium]
MKDVLIWIHGDCLNPHSPALLAHPDAPRVFVFDEEVLAHYRLSLKRIAFMYECLLEIPRVEIRKGQVVAELAEAAREQGCTRIVTVESIAPRFAQLRAKLQREHNLPVEVLPLEPFAELSQTEQARIELKRFSRYWNPIKAKALALNQSFDW